MALYDQKWKQQEAERIAKNRAGALETASAIGNWAAYGGVKPTERAPAFTAPDYTKPNPTNQPIMVQPVAAPKPGAMSTAAKMAPAAPKPAPIAAPSFSNVQGSMKIGPTGYGQTATQASRPGSQVGAGASPAAGAGSASVVKSRGKFGETVYSNTGDQYGSGTMAAGASTIGSVNQQNFGNPVVPQAQASIAQPRVASTFGMSVNDPRINDQTPRAPAITQPQQAASPNQASPFGAGFAGRMAGGSTPIARPGTNFQMAVPEGGTYRSADQMAEHYNSREAIEMQKKVLSDLDSARFRQELIEQSGGRRGRAATEALGNIASQQAAIANGMAGQAGAAVQGRAQRDNQFGIAGMEQAGANQRQQMQADVTREGNLLDYDAKNRATEASLIEKPQYITDDQRRYLRVGPDGATPVTDAAGNVIQMPQTQAQQRDYQGEAFNGLVTDLLEGQRDVAGNLPANAVQTAIQQAQQVQAARNPQRTKPDLATFLARAKAQGSKMTEEQLKAAYANL